MKVIALYGIGNSGKTSSITILYEKLKAEGIHNTNPAQYRGKDFKVAFVWNGKTIGIASAGDNKELLIEAFEFFERNNCELCICTARTKWGTQDFLTEREQQGDKIKQIFKPHVEENAIATEIERCADELFKELVTAMQ